MKKNRIAIIIVLVLGAIAAWLVVSNGKGSIKEELKDFAVKDTAAITKIFLADKSGKTITLTRESENAWRVNEKFYARQDAVNLLLYTISSLEVKQPVGKKAQENVIKNLATGSTKVEIYQGDELAKVYYVGGETQDQLGTFMLLANEKTGENSSVPFVMYIPGFEGFLTTRYFTDLAEWRDRSVFRYTPTDIKSIKVEYPGHESEGFEIVKKGENLWDVHTSAGTIDNFDTLAVKQYLSYYQNIQYENIEKDVVRVNKDSILASSPMAIITVNDVKTGISTAKLFYRRAGAEKVDPQGKPMKYDIDRLYGLVNNGQDFVLCQYYVFGKLLQTPPYFTKRENVVKKS
jgi:hypothetical protein